MLKEERLILIKDMRGVEIVEKYLTPLKQNMWGTPRIRNLDQKWINQEPLNLAELKELKTDAEKRQRLALVGTGLSFGILVLAIASVTQDGDSMKLAAFAPVVGMEVSEVTFAIYFNGKLYQIKNLLENARYNPQAY